MSNYIQGKAKAKLYSLLEYLKIYSAQDLRLSISGGFKWRRARHLPRVPFSGAPPRSKNSSFLMKNVLGTHIIWSESDHK